MARSQYGGGADGDGPSVQDGVVPPGLAVGPGVDVRVAEAVGGGERVAELGEGVEGGLEGGDVEAGTVLDGGEEGAGEDAGAGDVVVGGDLEEGAGAVLGGGDEAGGLISRWGGREESV